MKDNITLLQLVNFIFALSLGFALIFSISPLLFKEAKNTGKKLETIKKVDSIKINYTNNREKYLQLVLTTPAKNYIKHYFIPDNEHQNLINFLVDRKIVQNNFNNSLPIKLGKQQLSKFNIQLKNKNSRIEKLIINEIYLVGKSNSKIKKYLLFLFGILSFFLGILVLSLILLVTIFYFKTGELPDIPNKVEGIKHLLKNLKK